MKSTAEDTGAAGLSVVESSFGQPLGAPKSKNGTKQYVRETPIVAMDCEMVEVGGCFDALARVSIVNYEGQVLYDQYVKPDKQVTNFRTWVSGVTPSHMCSAKLHKEAKAEVRTLLEGKIVVGHGLFGDFRVLELNETMNKEKIRDTSKYKKYQGAPG